MYIDLEESIGTIDTTKAAYDRMIELKVASTQTILNYAELLRENNYFEEVRFSHYVSTFSTLSPSATHSAWCIELYIDTFFFFFSLQQSFKIYEQGIEQFVNSKQNYEIWLAYLEHFVTRYGASKLERARELFEQCLNTLGKDTPNTKAVFLMYANMEEEHGLTRR